MVALRALAQVRLARAAAARSRLLVMAAQASQAALAEMSLRAGAPGGRR